MFDDENNTTAEFITNNTSLILSNATGGLLSIPLRLFPWTNAVLAHTP